LKGKEESILGNQWPDNRIRYWKRLAIGSGINLVNDSQVPAMKEESRKEIIDHQWLEPQKRKKPIIGPTIGQLFLDLFLPSFVHLDPHVLSFSGSRNDGGDEEFEILVREGPTGG